MRYDSTATLKLNDHTALGELAELHRSQGIYNRSCAVTSEEQAVYHSFFKLDFGWTKAQVKAAIVKFKAQ